MNAMYVDESYDVPGVKLIVLEQNDLQTEWSGLAFAKLICIMLDHTFHLCLDMSKCGYPIAPAAMTGCFGALLQIMPKYELERRLWFYCPPDSVLRFLPNAQITHRKPRSIVLANVKVGPILPWNGQ